MLNNVPKTIGIVGSRQRNGNNDLQCCREAFDAVFEIGDRIVSGGCSKGGDRFAEIIAKERGLTIIIHYPDWNGQGRGAGFIRNTKIMEDADVLIALVANDRKGGTEDTVKKAMKLRKKVLLA